ncbi:acyltransferase [Alcaligenaceae bacterium B3P038]|nr:acyltransferase [Alcaligenaceae bacterium B3P038]
MAASKWTRTPKRSPTLTSGRDNVRKLDALTSLRFFAALAIVIHHSKAAFEATAWINSPIPLDYGVSFFFVLSGFILTYSHPESSKKTSARSFYVARFARIWPLHLVTFFLCLALIPERARLSPDSFDTTLANLTLVHAWIPIAGYFFSYNSVSWSISAEAFFYLCFPFLSKNLARSWHWKFLLVVALGAAVLFVATALQVPSYSHNAPFQVSSTGMSYISPFVRISEFFLGMLTALAYSKYAHVLKLKPVIWTLLEIGALALVPVMVHFSRVATGFVGSTLTHSEPVSEYLGHAGGAPAFMVVIFIMAFGNGYISRLLFWRPLVILGEASFALYLVHQIFIGWYFMNIPSLTAIPNNVVFVVYWVASILASLLLWRFVETPMRQKIRGWLAPRRSSPTAPV